MLKAPTSPASEHGVQCHQKLAVPKGNLLLAAMSAEDRLRLDWG